MDSVEALQITNAELGMEVKEAKAETDTATNWSVDGRPDEQTDKIRDTPFQMDE